MKEHALRLRRGTDFKKAIEDYCISRSITSAGILTCVGCVFELNLRLADGVTTKHFIEQFEITSLVGTVAKGKSHIHITCSNTMGECIGGHLMEGTLINTTAEIIMIELDEYQFDRAFDKDTGYDELIVVEKSNKNL